jgi:hypothetical protein
LLGSVGSRKQDLLGGRIEVLHVIGRAVVVASTALVVDVLTFGFPGLAASVACRRCSCVTLLSLGPTCGTGVPAASLVAVFVKLDTVPVAVGDDAVAGGETFSLLLLSHLELLVASVGGR